MSNYAITYSWEKGQYFAWLLNKSLHKLGVKHLIYFDEGQVLDPLVKNGLDENEIIIRHKKNYFGGHAGWPDAMQKIEGYKEANRVFNIQPSDWLMDMDDDTYMCNDGILKLLNDDVDLVGIQHEPKYETKIGLFGHMSGACVAMRGKILLDLISQNDDFWNRIYLELNQYNHCHMWDVVVSYACASLGARQQNITRLVDMSITPQDHFSGKAEGNFFHFNSPYKEFMGENINGKHDIPLLLHRRNLI